MYNTKRTFAGVRIQQTWSALFVLEQVIAEERPMRVIELGTGFGALTLFFSMFRFVDKVHTFDNKVESLTYATNILFSKENIFESHVKDKIRSLIGRQGKTFLFCDNGDKASEFILFAPSLKSGDIVFVHDWNVEIFEKDISDTVDKLGLEPVETVLCDEYKTLLRGYKMP